MRIFAISLMLFASMHVSQFLQAQNFSTGLSHFESKKYGEAFTQFSNIAKTHAQFAESRYYMGLISMQKNEQSKAEEYLKQAISANAGVANYHYSMAILLGQMAREANMVRQASLAGRIKTHLETAVKLDPKNMNASFMLVGLYMRAPKIMGGDPDKAKKVAADMVKINRAEGFRAAGFIAQSEEKFADAESNYRNALNASPDSLKYYSSLASFYQSRSNYTEALKVFESAMVKFPSNRNLLYQSGRIAAMAGSGQSEKASKYLNEYISGNTERNDRNVTNAWYYLGITEKNKNNQTAAKGHFNNALRINPDHKEAQQALKELN
jgi:tetratricopeptide (TPR) repeat protein